MSRRIDVTEIDTLTPDDDPRALGGDHRDGKRSAVTISYELRWLGDQLTVRLKGRPQDRSYVVFLVVEEKLLPSGQWLHTAYRFNSDGYMTFVPGLFFDKEREAIAKLSKMASDFAIKYSISEKPGPTDPVIGWVRPDNMLTREGLERFAALAEKHQPDLWNEPVSPRMEPKGLESV
jgi:hypothetical protein